MRSDNTKKIQILFVTVTVTFRYRVIESTSEQNATVENMTARLAIIPIVTTERLNDRTWTSLEGSSDERHSSQQAESFATEQSCIFVFVKARRVGFVSLLLFYAPSISFDLFRQNGPNHESWNAVS
jgi:hypothetical protein